MMKPYVFACASMVLTISTTAQAPVLMSEADYQAAKTSGSLAPGAVPFTPPAETDLLPPGGPERGGGSDDCECWIEPDASYTLAMAPNDDGSTANLPLGFTFDLYGDTYTSCFINNNGNISFLQAFGTFSATAFPNANNRMVAPFWADVDTRGNGGQVWYKITPTAMYVNWVGVGYFNQQTDKRNWFQVIITDGNDPVIGIGKNVSFCYKDMQWTTGSASQGVGGFGGIPATVGANRGNGTDFIQFGRFDQAGIAYDGPFGNPDGVSWLDFKNFVFTTVTSTQNIPPIAAGLYLCDTLRACVGQTADLELTFLSPENNQTTVATSSAPTISTWTEIANTSGIVASVTGQFTPTAGEIGFHTVTFTGTDDGAPNLSSIINIVIEVTPAPSGPPLITGPSAICAGQSTTLTATGPFSNFVWSNGQSGPSITVNQPGTFTVTGGTGLCQLTSPPFSVSLVNAPELTIAGPGLYCGEPLPDLTASFGYDSLLWSTGETDQTIFVPGGTYTVTGYYQGCVNVSAPFTVVEQDPGPPVINGALQYCEGANTALSVDGSLYDLIQWSTGSFDETITVTEGDYSITAQFLNCVYESQVTVDEIVLPPVSITGPAQLCEGGIVNISATPGFDNYTWNNNAVGQSISVQAGTYFVAASIGPCTTFSNTFTVTQVPNPAPVITGPNFSCGGTPVLLTTTQPFSSYNWSTGSTSSTTQSGSGAVTVTVTDANGCTGTSAPFNVTVANDPTADFGTSPESPQPTGTTVQFTDLSNGQGSAITDWQWTFDPNGNSSDEQSPEWTYSEPGQYWVTLIVTNAFGCIDTVSQRYDIYPPDITIPNVISPNGDRSNDFFVIENIEFWVNNLTVFNRWGQKVYEATNYRNTWKADDLPDGTYYYVLTLQDKSEYTGHVTVLR
ncbi:MAG: gliding motility-associated C-terminal domain-containing protein [Flavobacteriales bacterium]|nr:gliding motility-associated C-terminal domain-containing protein [Flavobacteriales bacterium]